MKLLRENSWSTLLLGGLVIVAFAGFWTAAQSRKQATEYERIVEERELHIRELTTVVELREKELREQVPVEVIKYIDREVPGPVRIREVIKWRTKTVEVPVERVREVTKWRDVVCNDLDWSGPDILYGYVEGHVINVDTQHGNTVVTGEASCYVDEVALIEDAPFDFEATNAWRRAIHRQPVHRNIVTLDGGVSMSAVGFDYNTDTYIDAARWRAGYSRILFPRKSLSLAVGGYVDADQVGARGSVMW